MIAFVLACLVLTLFLMWRYARKERAAGRPLGRWRLIERGIAVALLVVASLAVSIQVPIRYGLYEYFRAGWSDELARLMLVWLVFWGAAILQRTDEHISMPLLVNRLPGRLKRVARLFGDLCTLAVLGLLVWYGYDVASGSASFMQTLSLGLPISVFHYAVPTTGALMFLYTLVHVVKRARGREILPDPAAEAEEE